MLKIKYIRGDLYSKVELKKFFFKQGDVIRFSKAEYVVSSKLIFILNKNISRKRNEYVLKCWFSKSYLENASVVNIEHMGHFLDMCFIPWVSVLYSRPT